MGLNLSMGCIALPLDTATWKILQVIMQFGLFEYFLLLQ